MSMIGLGLFPFLTYYLYVVVPLAPLVYLFIKWRSYRNEQATDPWLGAAVLLQYFWTLALQLALFGMTLALAGLIKGRNADELNPGLGLLTSGLIVLIAAFFALKRLPASPQRSQSWRVFNALNLLICGLVALVALSASAILLYEGKTADLRLPLPAFFIFAAAWYWFLYLLIGKSKKSG